MVQDQVHCNRMRLPSWLKSKFPSETTRPLPGQMLSSVHLAVGHDFLDIHEHSRSEHANDICAVCLISMKRIYMNILIPSTKSVHISSCQLQYSKTCVRECRESPEASEWQTKSPRRFVVRNGASSAMRDCFWRLLNAWERAQEEKTCTEEAVQEKKLKEAGQRWLSKETDPGRACAKNTWQATWIKSSLGMKFYMDAFIAFIAFIPFTAFITLIALSECFSFIYAFLFIHVLFHLFDSIPLHSTPLHCIPFLAAPSTRTFGDAAPPNPYWARLRMHPFHSIPFINVIHYHSFIPASITSHFIIISLAQSLHLTPSTFNDVCIQSTFL